MSVQTEIGRLQTAKAELKSAIEAKGVTVPEAATLDGYGALVSQIEQSRSTNTYVSVSFEDQSDGAYVAFLKTREGYQTIAVHADTAPVEVETGSLALFALAQHAGYTHSIFYVQQGTYTEMTNVYLDENLFGPDAYEPHAVAFFSDSSVLLKASSSSGGSSN